MAFNVSSGSGMGRGRRQRYRPLAEINVTPLVDVMLVLLIVFMVTAPLLTSGVNVDLPKASAAPVNQDSTPITVSINAQGNIYLGDDQVDLDDLVVKLKAASQDQPDRRIFVRGDKGITYGRIMEVMGTITQSGFTKVALLADAPAGMTPTPAATAPAGAPASPAPSGQSAAPGAPRRAAR